MSHPPATRSATRAPPAAASPPTASTPCCGRPATAAPEAASRSPRWCYRRPRRSGGRTARSTTPRPGTPAAGPRARGANRQFARERQAHWWLDVFGVAGRRGATLVDDVRDPGEYEIAWDGATGVGHGASGVFFARVTSPEGRASATVILA